MKPPINCEALTDNLSTVTLAITGADGERAEFQAPSNGNAYQTLHHIRGPLETFMENTLRAAGVEDVTVSEATEAGDEAAVEAKPTRKAKAKS